MTRLKSIMVLGLGLLVSACGAIPNAATPIASTAAPLPASLPASLSVSDISVMVPYSLQISEGNGYYPNADIVWRGDPIGDRRAQIRTMMETAFARGTRSMEGTTPVMLDVQVKRFHSVSDRARASVGGVHHMVFDLTVSDARTGAIIAPAREVNVSLRAYGGVKAMQAERRGQTQKVRVTGHLARVIQQELGQPITQ